MSVKFHMPAEWSPHRTCWMLWPYRGDNWHHHAAPAQATFLQVAKAIAEFEPVQLGVLPSLLEQTTAAFDSVKSKHPISLIPMKYDDSWMRDVGPTFVFQQKEAEPRCLLGMDWIFNAWGGKTSSWDQDKLVAEQVLHHIQCPGLKTDFVLEGGSIHVDGEGTLITTEECLLNINRNPQLSKPEIEERLRLYLGVKKVIWLPFGLAFDEDTDGHIDNMCCFSKPGEVLLCWTDDEKDENYSRCREALQVLEQETDQSGRKIKVIKLPIPEPMYYTAEEAQSLSSVNGILNRREGVRLAGSYVNFYIANEGIVCPSFGCPQDTKAQAILQSTFPQHRVVAVPGREILLGGGNIHCITQQEPLLLS